MNVNEIVTKLYEYFPKDHSPFSNTYSKTKEAQLKDRVIYTLKKDAVHKWNTLINLIEVDLGHSSLVDHTPQLENNFCNYSTCIHVFEKMIFRIHILVCLLEPFHTILVSSYSLPNQNYRLTTSARDVSAHINSVDSQAIVTALRCEDINIRIEQIFQSNFIEMSTLQDVIISDIALQNKNKGTVNLFDCLFVTELFLL